VSKDAEVEGRICSLSSAENQARMQAGYQALKLQKPAILPNCSASGLHAKPKIKSNKQHRNEMMGESIVIIFVRLHSVTPSSNFQLSPRSPLMLRWVALLITG